MENTSRSRWVHEAFNARDWVELVRECAPDMQYTDRARDVTAKGPDEFVDYLRDGWVAAFSDAAISRATYLEATDAVVAQFVGTGTHDGPLGDVPASGRSVRLPFCEVLHFNPACQIVSGELYYDRLTLLAQLGLTAPEPPT